MGLFADNRSLLILCMISVLKVKLVSSDGTLELELRSFTNNLGVLMDGTPCNGGCQISMEFCVAQGVQLPNSNCSFGSKSTGYLGGNHIEFQAGKSLGNDLTNPIQFPFRGAWPTEFGLYIDVLDDGTYIVDEYFRAIPVNLGENKQNAQWSSDIMMDNNNIDEQQQYTSTRLRVKVYCAEDWYRSDCNTYCLETDKYECNYNTGIKECKSGWGPDYICNSPKCTTGCDKNHGMCEEPFECICDDGWEGRLCDQCIPRDGCVHGGCTVRGHVCECEKNWRGEYCTIDQDSCRSTPCQNGANCNNTGDDAYTCNCNTGFSGHNCEEDINECESSPCQNGGICSDKVGSYKCKCSEEYQGVNCEIGIAEDCIPEDEPQRSHGETWEVECNGFECDNGVIKYSKIWCGPENCFDDNSDIDENGDDVIKTCTVPAECTVPEYDCLQGQCEDFGKCINENEPLLQDGRCGASFYEEKATTYACEYVGMKINYNILPQNTSVEDVCNKLRYIINLREHAMDSELVILCNKESGEDNIIYVSHESDGGLTTTKDAIEAMSKYIKSLPEDTNELILKSITIFTPTTGRSTSSSTGIWLPILLGFLFFLILIAIIVFIIWYRRRKQREDKHIDHPLSRLTLKMRENPFFEEKEDVEDYNVTTYVQNQDKLSSADADYELDAISLSSHSDNGQKGVVSEADADYVAMDDNAGEWQGPQPETFSKDGSPDMV